MSPGRWRRQAARDHRERRRREPWQQALAEPLVHGAQPLVAVHQQDHSLAKRRKDLTAVSGYLQNVCKMSQKGVRSACQISAVDSDHGDARITSDRRVLIEQRALAHPARAIHEQHPQPRISLVERRPKEAQFSHATDELLASTSLKPSAQGSRRVTILPGHVLNRDRHATACAVPDVRSAAATERTRPVGCLPLRTSREA